VDQHIKLLQTLGTRSGEDRIEGTGKSFTWGGGGASGHLGKQVKKRKKDEYERKTDVKLESSGKRNTFHNHLVKKGKVGEMEKAT